MDKASSVWYVIIICLVGLIVGIIIISEILYDPYDYETTRTYTVVCGDTLWEIADGLKTDEQNIFVVMDEIKEINDCGDSLKIGQKLELPIYR